MKNFRKTIAAIVCTALLFAMSGCIAVPTSSSDTTPSTTPSQPTEPTHTDPPTQPPIEPPTEPPTEPPAPKIGWIEEGGKRYYYDENSVMLFGWQTIDEKQYYFESDGAMAVGKTEIEGKTLYFGSDGIQILLVNPWNYLPEDYDPEIILIDDWRKGASICYQPLMDMLQACRDAGHRPYVSSAYRTHGDQIYLHNRMIQKYIDRGYSEEEAYTIASTIVAIPGTSEHELGLAFDIVDYDYRELNEAQEETETQKWLMEHCWEFGFILRYPSADSEITGIIYEPWHYRYIGVEEALKIRDSGLCLEAYLESLD